MCWRPICELYATSTQLLTLIFVNGRVITVSVVEHAPCEGYAHARGARGRFVTLAPGRRRARIRGGRQKSTRPGTPDLTEGSVGDVILHHSFFPLAVMRDSDEK